MVELIFSKIDNNDKGSLGIIAKWALQRLANLLNIRFSFSKKFLVLKHPTFPLYKNVLL